MFLGRSGGNEQERINEQEQHNSKEKPCISSGKRRRTTRAEFGLDLLFCHVHLQLLQLVSLGSKTMRKSLWRLRIFRISCQVTKGLPSKKVTMLLSSSLPASSCSVHYNVTDAMVTRHDQTRFFHACLHFPGPPQTASSTRAPAIPAMNRL